MGRRSSRNAYLSAVAPSTVIRIRALLILLLLWSWAFIVYLRPWLKFIPRLGIYQDRKSGLYYCPSCYAKKLRSPLKHQKHGWQCEVKECNKFYRNPDYKKPPPDR